MSAPTGKSFDRAIVEGPIARAVWKLAWPTMIQNIIGGLQGIVDHAMVGHFVGYTANAGIEIGRASCRKECRSRWSPYH